MTSPRKPRRPRGRRSRRPSETTPHRQARASPRCAARLVRLRAAIGRADALLFCTPEYAGALPGAFTNLLDWTVGDPGPRSMNGKPVGWLNVSSPVAPTGAADAHESLSKVMGYLGASVVGGACRRIPLTRASVGADGLVHEPDARSAALAALRALSCR